MRTIGRHLMAGALALAVCALVASIPASAVRRSAAPPPVRQDWGEGGQTSTRLADGRTLVMDGQTARGISPVAHVIGPLGGSRDIALPQGRAWHTATVLPDGRVLIAGGLGSGSQVIASADAFDPVTSTFAAVPVSNSVARMGHTTTLLSDGRLLVVGGEAADGTPASAEIWTLTGSGVIVVPLGGGTGRTRHTATLMPDGRVLIAGGRDGAGRARTDAEIFDPIAGRFERSGAFDPDERPARLSGSRPDDGATDVPLDVRVALRFSSPVALATLSSMTATLASEDGPVSVRIVPAEGGRLVFLQPANPLTARTRYVVEVKNVQDDSGAAVKNASLSFTTAADERTAATDDPDDERWVPDGHDREAGGWRTGRANSSWLDLAPLLAEPGTTAVSGQVLRLDGKPLAGVTLAIAGHDVETDRTGRFLLPLPGVAPGHHELEIKGETANHGQRRYGYFEYGMEIAAGRTTVLAFTIWMPLLDTTHEVAIASPTLSETVITTPYIPGLELHLPAGTTITDESGEPVRKLSITPIPVDRPPFPLARNVEVPVYFTVQPGGAYVSTTGSGPKGAWLVYPNYKHEWAGKRIQFFHYDPKVLGWYVYGLGTVTANAAQVMPDARTRLYAFTGAMINGAWSPAAAAKPPGECRSRSCDGDPVNLTTGLFSLDETDLMLPDVLPIALTRTYRTRDLDVRPFGVGTTHPYAMFLWSAHQYTEADLILPDGGRIHYVRTSPGTGWTDAIFEHIERPNPPQGEPATSATPTEFYRSIMKWNGNGWDITLKSGMVYVFGENAPLQAIRDRNGNTLTVFHQNGQLGPVTRVTTPHGRWIEFTYTNNTISQVKDNIGRVWVYEYNPVNDLVRVTDPLSHATEYTYDSAHRMLTVKNRNGVVVVANEYYTATGANQGWVKKQTLADGGTFQFSYTIANGKSTQTDVTNPRAYVRRTTFDADGYLTSDTQALGELEERTTAYTRDAGSHALLSVTDPLNRLWTYTLDAYGHTLEETQLAGTPGATTIHYTYEPVFGQLATITDPLNHTITLGYDSRSNRTTVTDALAHSATIEYNSEGRPVTVIDPLQNHTQITYAGADAATVIDPLGRTTTRFTDGAGRVLSEAGPDGIRTIFAFDAADRMTQVTTPLNVTTTYSYDADDNLGGLTDALNHTTGFGYDVLGRLVARTDPFSKTDTIAYDLNGNPIQSTDRRSLATVRVFDPLDRLIEVTYADGSTVTYGYDANDRITTIADSIDGIITRVYDDFDNLLSETTPRGTITYTYDAAGRRASMALGGRTVVYGYDAADRLTTVAENTAVVAIAYDAAGRRTSLMLPNGGIVEYSYDVASQLTGLTYKLGAATVGSLAYAYDAAGRRTEQGGTWARTSLAQPMTGAGYDAGNRLMQWMGRSLDYDAAGNLVSDGLVSYAWNARNQLTSVLGSATATYQYDGIQRRSRKTVEGQTTEFMYDADNVVREVVGAVAADFLTGLDLDEAWSRTDPQGPRYNLSDAIGSAVARMDDSGAVQTQLVYAAFGETHPTGESDVSAFQFTGREQDASDRYFLRARYYNPALQRFISEDPEGLAAGLNLYAYVSNRPLDLTDRFGLSEKSARCDSIRNNIESLKRSIFRQERNIRLNPKDLPEECPFDWDKRSTSVRGHRYELTDTRMDLLVQEVLYAIFCGPQGPKVPNLVPVLPPIPAPTPEQQRTIAVVGTAGILSYWWVVFAFGL